MKLKVFVPKDRSGNEEPQSGFCLRPISYCSGPAWEAGGGVNWKWFCPTFCPCSPRPQQAGPGGCAAARVTTAAPLSPTA